jgi:aminoglycoside phosphotransferase (APT) family kinase protein
MIINTALVKKLIKEQFPHWENENISPVEKSGWDNRTFHLGENLLVRLPSADHYISQVEKEQKWLPKLAEELALSIPKPVAQGVPSERFPRPWSVYEWIEGETLPQHNPENLNSIAYDLATFLNSLDLVNTKNAPLAGKHNFYRGCSLKFYENDVLKALSILGNQVDATVILELWEKATTHEWTQAPVWVHGDMSIGNFLVRDGKLTAIIDFGSSAVGDPACDLVIAWTLFKGKSREIFKETRKADKHTWNRGRGWALWKALIVWSGLDSNQADRDKVEVIVRDIINDYDPSGV